MKTYLLGLPLCLSLAACDVAQEPGPKQHAAAPPPVYLIHNALIHTVDDERPVASAMAWDASGQILAVGEISALRLAYPGATQRDLRGRTVIPGLIDSHGHLTGLALSLSQAQLVGTASVEEVLVRLREHEQKIAPGDWLLGHGWDQNDWPEQRFPDRRALDADFPDRPVWLRRIDGHAGWANSAALAQVDRNLEGDWQPPGGFIHRDAAGQPTGILVDGAMALVERLVPEPSDALLVESLGVAIGKMVRLGLTGVHDPGVDRAIVQRYRRLIEAGRFDTRVYAMADGVGDTLEWLCKEGTVEHASGRLSMRSVKLYADGALGSRGAALLEDYADDPGNRGLLFLQPAELEAQLRRVMGCGLQAAIHAIGDRANRAALDALETVAQEFPSNPGRHRIEHVQVLASSDLARFSELGVIAAMQPTHATSDMYWAEDRLRAQRLQFAYAWRSLLDSGARLALGSDFPVEEVNPLLGIHAAVSRQDSSGWPEEGWQAQERISRAEALRGFALDAAHAGFMEHSVGSLRAGKRADFVVLDRDLMAAPVAEIPEIRVLETWLDGKRVYAAAPSSD
jgi:predicted amidohydrolase YtcJ